MKVSRVRVSGLARLGSAWGGDYMVAGSGWAARYPRVMRYLTRSFAIGAPRSVAWRASVGWAVSPWENSCYRVSLHTVQGLDDEGFADLSEFPSLDPDDEQYAGEGRELGRSADEAEAIELAERLTGAVPDRWVNFAVAGQEYLDFIRSRRGGGNRS